MVLQQRANGLPAAVQVVHSNAHLSRSKDIQGSVDDAVPARNQRQAGKLNDTTTPSKDAGDCFRACRRGERA